MKRKNNRPAAFTALPLLVLMAIAACGTGVEPGVRVVALGEPSVQRLQDDLHPLRSLNSIQYLSDDSFVALDQAGQVVFVAGGAVRRRIGVKGEGPCQLEKPFGIASDGETVQVLDIDKSAVLIHSLATGACVREVHHPLLRRMSGLLKVGDDLILSRGGLFSPSDSSASLLYLLTSRDSIRSLPVTFADITTIGAPMPVRMSMPVRRAGNKIYFSINLATAVVFYDLNTSEKSTTVLSLDVPAGMGDKSPDEFMTALLGDTEMLFDYHVIDGRLVTITRKTVEGAQRWFVSFLGDDGAPDYVSEPIAEHVTWVTESEIMSIGPDTVSVDGGHILRSYPYSLPRR